MPYPTKPKGGWQWPRQVVVNKSTVQLREKEATWKFMNKYQETIQNSMAQGPNDPQGPFLYQEDGKTYASLPAGMLQNIQRSPLFDKMKKDCQAEGVEIPQTIMAKDPVAHMLTPQEYLQKVVAGQIPQMDNHQMMKELAYTIAIVQNSQVLQYDQMHTALQTARNQASLETPLRVEELLTAHFNLAVLEDQKDTDKSPDAQKSTDNTQDAEPSASAPDEQTYIKIPSRYAENSATRRPHPTAAVAPTCRHEYGLVNAIPAGYKSDDSWDNLSHTHEHTHTHNIVPLLTLRPWGNSPRRGREQQQLPRQNNNTNVRIGHALYSRPWDNQPYGRHTRSQQALYARAYHKIQCRYPIQ